MIEPRTPLPGSSRTPRAGESWLGPADPDQQLTATVYLRRQSSEELAPGTSREEAIAALSANPADLQTVRSFAQRYGLRVTAENAAARTIQLTGSIPQLEAAFGVELGTAQDQAGDSYLTYRGEMHVPPEIASVATAILGLDQARIARHHGTST